MDSIDDDVGAEAVVAEYFTDDSGVAMVEWPHSVEGVRRVARSGCYGILSDRHLSVGVSNAYANIAPRSLRNHAHRAGNFRGNRQHAHMPTRRLPKALEDVNGRRDQIFRRMHSSPLVAQKWSFEMKAQRPSL